MSTMESETYKAPLFQAYMLGHGQKRKHSNGSVGLLTSPTSSRIALRATDVAQSSRAQGYAQDNPAGLVNLDEETDQEITIRPYIRLDEYWKEDSSQKKSPEGSERRDEHAKPLERASGSIPFPSRTGQADTFEPVLGGDYSHKFPDPNNPPEIAVAVRPRKDPAPRFFGDAIADFYPWKGDEVEDKLTEQVIKTGLTDRFHVPGECNSANTTLGVYLKQPSTLQNLSTLLVTAMHMRQENNRVTATSTFKPPPRVTLTDTRREAWLRDLADEAIPVRRLSRTIPHGIRGRLLLDHCLEKRIPVKRAVWLAQCVGANEIRAFKRKGVSGAITTSNERKWVQDWTTTLESFLETVLKTCDKQEGPGQLDYAVELTRHLYSDQLVDQEHFLTWTLSTTEQSKISRLPLCLVVLRVIWKDLTLSFRLSSRLVALLVKALSILMKHQKEAEVPKLITHLQHFLASILKLQPLAVPAYSRWQSSRPSILALLKTPIVGSVLNESRMLERNDRLSAISSGVSCDSLGPKQKCCKMLDERMARKRSLINVDKLINSCLEMFEMYEDFVLAVLHWACSLYRVGYGRIYLVTRLLQNLNKRQYDITGTVLQCLGSLRASSGISALSVTRLLTELSRRKAFEIGRYLRWLIATGALNGCSEQDFLVRCDIRFLIDMPSSKLSGNVASMRSMLLRQAHISPKDSRPLAMDLIHHIERYLGNESDDPDFAVNLDDIRQQVLDPATADILADWILRTCLQSRPVSLESSSPKEQNKIMLGRDGLSFVLEILGNLCHHDAIEKCISFYINYSDMDMLVALSQALFINREELGALGTLYSLWFKLLERYYHLRHNNSPEKHAVSALERIASDLSLPAQVVDYLKQEVASAGQHSVSIVYTPASEGMMDTAENNITDSEEEIERMLGATTNLDPSSMRRIFLLLVKRLMDTLEDSNAARCSRFCSLLSKLRALGADEYFKLVNEFLDKIKSRTEIQQRPHIFKTLIGGDVCTVTEIAKHAHTATEHPEGIYDFLDIILNPGQGTKSLEPSLHYNFLVQRTAYIEDQCNSIVDDIIQAVAQADPELLNAHGRLNELLQHPVVGELLKCSILTDSKCFAEKLEVYFKRKLNGKDELLLKLLGQLMESDEVALSRRETANSPLAHSFPLRTVFESVDELSLPFWRLITTIRLRVSSEASKHLGDWREEAVEAAKSAHMKADSFWTCLLSNIGDLAARDIFLFVANTILAPAKLGELVMSDSQISHKRVACSEILKSTAFSVRETSQPEVTLKAVTALSSLYARWGDRDPDVLEDELRDDRKAFTSYLRIVLNLALVLHNSIRRSTHCSDLFQILCRFLATDISIYDAEITEFVFDIAAFFSTFLDSNTLGAMAESLPDPVKRHEAVRFLLGTNLGSDSWLHIAQRLPSHQHATSSSPGNNEQIYSSTTPFPLRSWELLPDAAPAVGPNDTALSLRLFDAKKLS